jgi:hypothetical protein
LRIDDWLHAYVAAGVAEESADLAKGEGSDAFKASGSAADAAFVVGECRQCFLAEVDVQHHL